MTLAKWINNFTLSTKNPHAVFDREIKASKHIPISHFVTPEIFSTKNGEIGAVIKIIGTSFDVRSEDELNQLQNNISFAIQSLGDEFAIYITTYRHQQPSILEGEYPEGFSKDYSSAYNAQFKQAKLFMNDIYFTVMMKSGSTNLKKGMYWLEQFNMKNNADKFKRWQKVRLQHFKEAITNMMSSLDPYTPSLLGASEAKNINSAKALSFFSILINGYERDFEYPQQDIASYIPEKRLYFGKDTIHFQGLSKGDDRFGAILSIKTYCPRSMPGMLSGLLTVPFEYIATHSFLSIEKTHALNMIDKQIRRLNSTKDAATSQIGELEQAKDDLASGKINYGLHHNTILVLGNSVNGLEEKVADIVKIYQDQRLVVIRETINLENAFWAQIPGNFKKIRRSAPISNHNLTSFCPLHNYYPGYINENHLGSALMLIETPSKTPLYLNLHERASGRKDDLPKGHTLLIGPSNAGKTVVMLTIDAMLQKHGIRSIIFDRNQGCEIYVRAMGGIYNRLVPGVATGWNPLQLEDTASNRKFLRDFLEVLCTNKINPLSSSDLRQIAEVVDRNFSLPLEKRNLSNLSSFFRLDFSGLDSLSRYLSLPDRNGKSGDRAYLFDNEVNQLNLNARTIGFDMTHWLSDAGQRPDELLPISMYLFHCIEEILNGELTGIYLEEGWQFLEQPYWKEKIDEFIVTLRKRNAFIFMPTQLPDKLAKSSLASALIQGSATIIYLANPKAQEEDYINGFKLTKREYEIIKNTDSQSRFFLIKQGHESAIGRMNLKGLEDYISVLSGNDNTVNECADIRKEVGDNPSDWLPIFYQRSSK